MLDKGSTIVRQWLESQGQAYVLAVTGKERVWIDQRQHAIKTLLADVPTTGWERISAGMGSKGPRWYDWQRIALTDPAQPRWSRWLVIRRSLRDPTALTAYLTFAPTPSSLADLVRVAGMRWTVEESIQTAKGEIGLDHYEVRSWTGWYRHMTLAMWAQTFLAVIRAEQGAATAPKKGLQNPKEQRSLAAFKAHRGLPSA